MAFLSLFHSKTKFFYTEHNTHNARRKPIFWLLEKFVYARYNSIICITEGVSQALTKWVGSTVKTNVINNVIDKSRILESNKGDRSSFQLKNSDRLLVMIGRFHKQKDQDTILRALTKLPWEYKLLLIGEGSREEELKDLVTQLELTDRVQFLGIRTDVFSIIKMCDYGVLSSHWEGFGIVALEYMACGVPTIGSNVDGLREVICPKEALFEKENETQLAQLILKIEDNKELCKRIIAMQQEQIVNFDIETSLQKHFNVYNGV